MKFVKTASDQPTWTCDEHPHRNAACKILLEGSLRLRYVESLHLRNVS